MLVSPDQAAGRGFRLDSSPERWAGRSVVPLTKISTLDLRFACAGWSQYTPDCRGAEESPSSHNRPTSETVASGRVGVQPAAVWQPVGRSPPDGRRPCDVVLREHGGDDAGRQEHTDDPFGVRFSSRDATNSEKSQPVRYGFIILICIRGTIFERFENE